jgi:hypothetical protein
VERYSARQSRSSASRELVSESQRRCRPTDGEVFEFSYELTEYEPPKRSSVKAITGLFPFSGSYSLEPRDGATRFTITGDIEAHGFFKLAQPVLRRIAAMSSRRASGT